MENESPILDLEVLKLYKLRKILSKAWMPLGIGKNEACDILEWMIGKDVTQLHFSLWPERIMQNTGIKFNSKEPMLFIFRKAANEWRKRKPVMFMPRNFDN